MSITLKLCRRNFLFLASEFGQCTEDTAAVCHSNATCLRTRESFTCSCNPGFFGNGSICESKKTILYSLVATLLIA